MDKKYILGLDLGTNSIGWAVVGTSKSEESQDFSGEIISSGVRTIPMDAATLGDFDKGNLKSQTAARRELRSMRRLYERSKLRRERLHRVLSLMGFLPEHYSAGLDRYGKFKDGQEVKLAWDKDENGKQSFIFRPSFCEMLDDFRRHRPELVAGEKEVPYDWTIYYLRKKALTQKIGKEELAWILLNFNQKRGYYQLRGEDEEERQAKTRQEFDRRTIVDIADTGEVYKGSKVLLVTLDDGRRGKIFQKEMPDWKGRQKDIIVTVDLDKNGKDKCNDRGEPDYRFRIPTEAEWETQWKLIKAKTQNDLDASGKTVGAYIYDALLQMPGQKIRGKLVRTVERKYYKDELRKILEKQKEFYGEFQDRELYEACLRELYPVNDAHRAEMNGRELTELLMDDVLFYQRPLKSKKSLISDCPYEYHESINHETGEVKRYPVKCIPKSHPLFQEFRLWQFVSNLRIYQREAIVNGKLCVDVDVTADFLKDEDDYVDLFNELNKLKSIKQDKFLTAVLKLNKNEKSNYRWKYVEDKEYPCNKTHAAMLECLDKAKMNHDFLTAEREEALWHILYSVSDKAELEKALRKFIERQKCGCDESTEDAFVEAFRNMPPFEKDYGAYSAKALRKLLPLMRTGKSWSESAIDAATHERILRLIGGEYGGNMPGKVKDRIANLKDVSAYRGLPLWLACYVVYDRHSEAKDICKWGSPDDIDVYLRKFRQHSLRNPIVEQVVLETLRTVRDIWRQVGHIDEIHIELGRNMKLSNEERREQTKKILENENTNFRIKALLTEFMNPEFKMLEKDENPDLEIENVRPYSPIQQEKLRIYEETVLSEMKDVPNDIKDIIRKLGESDAGKRPTASQVLRYRLWLDQKYVSPYTGKAIPLAKLFTTAYQVDHIIPRKRYFDDSLSNKVICEAEVNSLKDCMLGYEFITRHGGEKVTLSGGGTVTIRTVHDYEQFVKTTYADNKKKMKKLLMEDIPDDFTSRQLNDSRYISKFIKSLLSNIVREEGELEDISKNMIVCTGCVTDRLKKDWGVNDVWNEIILPRFIRMKERTGNTGFTSLNNNNNNKTIPDIPLEYQKGFSKKRIDHRHHAMDAIVIACANRNIVNYLNNESANKKDGTTREDLQRLLCYKSKPDNNGNYRWIVKKPWGTFTQDVYASLKDIVVSFKQNLRVISKMSNMYQHYENGKKRLVRQEKGDMLAIRKSLHKDTYYGAVNLRKDDGNVSLKEAMSNPDVIVEKDLKRKLKELIAQGLTEKQIRKYFEDNKDVWQDVDLKKIKAYYFTKDKGRNFYSGRKLLDSSFTKKKIEDDVTDTGIRKILLLHLEQYGNDAKTAFSPEGIEQMNKNIVELNNGKYHQPIYKVRVCEESDSKFAVGQKGNKVSKFVEVDKGTNLFFAVYEKEEQDKVTGKTIRKRTFATIPLQDVISRAKKQLPPAPEELNGSRLKFVLSPNDLVYVPTAEELESGNINRPLDRSRIYKMVSCNDNRLFVIPYYVARVIVDKQEYQKKNKLEITDDGMSVKEVCIPLEVDRLGNINIKGE